MHIKKIVVIYISKILISILRSFKSGGTNLPGKIAKKFYPELLGIFSKQLKIVFVTGTNGKTTTTKILSDIFDKSNISYITNKSGANLSTGIFTTLLASSDKHGKINKEYGLFEIDEAAFAEVTNYLIPEVLIVTNFFRDQLDRFGELYTTVSKVKMGIEKHPNTTLILNADDSLSVFLSHNLPNKIVFYGMNSSIDIDDNNENSDATYCIICKNKYGYSKKFYGHLGHFYCNNCGYKRPIADISIENVEKLDITHSEITIKDNINKLDTFKAKVNLPGLYNIYNSITAYAGATMLGIDNKYIVNSLGSFSNSFGRMENIKIKNKNIKLILVKNPTGYNQVLNFLKQQIDTFSIIMALNDKLADSTDISWIWDVNFELLENIQISISKIYTSGIRAEDMSLRLKYAGVYTNKIVLEKDYEKLIEIGVNELKADETLFILPTYTCMLAIRKILCSKYQLKDFWE